MKRKHDHDTEDDQEEEDGKTRTVVDARLNHPRFGRTETFEVSMHSDRNKFIQNAITEMIHQSPGIRTWLIHEIESAKARTKYVCSIQASYWRQGEGIKTLTEDRYQEFLCSGMNEMTLIVDDIPGQFQTQLSLDAPNPPRSPHFGNQLKHSLLPYVPILPLCGLIQDYWGPSTITVTILNNNVNKTLYIDTPPTLQDVFFTAIQKGCPHVLTPKRQDISFSIHEYNEAFNENENDDHFGAITREDWTAYQLITGTFEICVENPSESDVYYKMTRTVDVPFSTLETWFRGKPVE